jgi:hypothetical protein
MRLSSFIRTLIAAYLSFQIDGEKSKQIGNLPTIFLIGAQKGGTSSLFELMIQHPLLCPGEHKEPHFFDHPENFNKGVDFYRRIFTDQKCNNNSSAHFIDGTPIMHHQYIWGNIYSIYEGSKSIRKDLKFIALLREPVARDYSWYKHAVRTG